MGDETCMTSVDQKTFFTALGFLAVAMKGENPERENEAERVRQLASLIESFCAEHVCNPTSSDLPDMNSIAEIDRLIGSHIQNLRQKEETRLPEDKATLIGLCDRLQHRKARRMQREFYAAASEAKLADLVLRLLDEEINDDSNRVLA